MPWVTESEPIDITPGAVTARPARRPPGAALAAVVAVCAVATGALGYAAVHRPEPRGFAPRPGPSAPAAVPDFTPSPPVPSAVRHSSARRR